MRSFLKNQKKDKKIKSKSLPKQVVALDIGSYALKIALIEFEDEPIIKKLIYYPWQIDLPYSDATQAIFNNQFYKELDTVLYTNNIKCRDFLLVAINSKLVVQPIKLPPNINSKDINQLLDYQIEDNISYKKDEIYYDYTITNVSNDVTEINLFASEKTYIDELINIFKSLKKKIHFINVAPISLYNLITYKNKIDLFEREIFVIINVGASVTELSIYKKDQILLYRTIPIAGNKFTDAFSNDKDITYDLAEENKYNFGLDNVSENVNILAVQNELFEQLWRSIQYIIARNQNLTLRHIYVTGGTANMKHLISKFHRYLEVKMIEHGEVVEYSISVLNPFEILKVDENVDLTPIKKFSSCFSTILGLVCGD